VGVALLRAPGIYAAERLPLERLRRGDPALEAEDDSYSNHIHADDLARLAWLATFRAGAGRVYNACDDSDVKMGDWFDLVADAHGLPHPPRIGRAEAEQRLSPVLWSFMRESRRIANRRIKRELRARLRYPTVRDGLAEARATTATETPCWS
jgi:nucleoside-diphosphate-sugar epimerase